MVYLLVQLRGKELMNYLKQSLKKTSSGLLISDDSQVIIESSRQHDLLIQARESIDKAIELVNIDIGLDIVAVELTSAMSSY